MHKHRPQLQQHNTNIPTTTKTKYAEMQDIEQGRTTCTSPPGRIPAPSPTTCPRHTHTPSYHSNANHTAQPHLTYHCTTDTHACHNHFPTHKTQHTTWTFSLATNTKAHKHHTHHTHTPHNPTLKQPSCPLPHSTYTIPNTQQTTTNQPHKHHAHNHHKHTLILRNNVNKNRCNKLLKTENLPPPPRRTHINHIIHTLTNPNYQPYLNFKLN